MTIRPAGRLCGAAGTLVIVPFLMTFCGLTSPMGLIAYFSKQASMSLRLNKIVRPQR
jgi:hypothetical protein